MNTKQLFDTFTTTVNTRWRVNKEKAGKDIVGEEYESFRKAFWKQFNFSAKPETIASYDADLVIRDSNDNIRAIEECKGHYVDSCFLDRFVMNAARVLKHYLDQGVEDKDIPYIVLSCPTTYSLYNSKLTANKDLFDNNIRRLLNTKVKYLTLCSHDRVSAKKYFKNNDSGFSIDSKLILEQENFANNI